ncbi:MAG: ferrochelatase [Paludibacter sp.]
MTGVLLVNMGSPLSKKQMRQFLFNMFSDKAILPFPKLQRTALAYIISTFRYRGSWNKYEQIGGSKLMESMGLISKELSTELGADFLVLSAYSYSLPSIQTMIEAFRNKGITDIKIITMYPHSSFSTTESVKTDVDNVLKKYPELNVTTLGTYAENKHFISYWVTLVQETIQKNNYKNPTLLFSAHAIPTYQVENGDTYVDEINASAKLISAELGLPYKVSFQSKIGKVKWVEPDTKDCLKGMAAENCDEIILVPISFVNENLETAYDQGIEIIPYGKNELHIKNICRATIPYSHPLLIATFKQLLTESK